MVANSFAANRTWSPTKVTSNFRMMGVLHCPKKGTKILGSTVYVQCFQPREPPIIPKREQAIQQELCRRCTFDSFKLIDVDIPYAKIWQEHVLNFPMTAGKKLAFQSLYSRCIKGEAATSPALFGVQLF